MYKLMEQVHPRFSETDALGHINNTVVPVWFEAARTPIFKIFTPNLDPKQWKLIIAKIEVEFKGELFYGEEVEIRTGIERIGNSSYVIVQEAWQGGARVPWGKPLWCDIALQINQRCPCQKKSVRDYPHSSSEFK